MEHVHLSLDHIGQMGLLLDEAHEEGLQLLAIQLGQQGLQGRPLLDLRGAVPAGQQGRDDMLAPAAPIVGARAAGLGDAPPIPGDLHRVGLDLAPRHLGLELLATAHQAYYRALRIILTAALV
jgi:hypothetical protein